MAPFLDLVFSFGAQLHQEDFHYTAFRHESCLDEANTGSFDIPRLGRSGRSLQQCYNLWSVEKSDADGSWAMRQTAVYHSFDLGSGRALWLNVKANELMLKRVTGVTETSPKARASSLLDAASSFAATLVTHLVMFEWCSENWRPFLGSLDIELRAILTKVKNAPINEVERALAVNPHALISPVTSPSPGASPQRAAYSRSNTFHNWGTTTGTRLPDKFEPPGRILSGLTATSLPQGQFHKALDELDEHTDNCLSVLDQFSFDELQRLHRIGARLHEAGLVIKLNAEVLSEVSRYYQEILEHPNFPLELKDGCRAEISGFLQSIKGIVRDLAMERCRVETMMGMLEDGKTLVWLSSPRRSRKSQLWELL